MNGTNSFRAIRNTCTFLFKKIDNLRDGFGFIGNEFNFVPNETALGSLTESMSAVLEAVDEMLSDCTFSGVFTFLIPIELTRGSTATTAWHYAGGRECFHLQLFNSDVIRAARI